MKRRGRDWPCRSAGPDAVLARERRKQIERAIADLPEVYRKVFLLADVDGQPNADIAEAMRLSLSAVKSRLHRARQLMLGALASYLKKAPFDLAASLW